ncbi:hypothetical protein SAMD00019534_068290 [Acytostelium subglobosum LB1]|uniref:hypothetical protein n=1 Tax=Acytostelium subglobosum LB1 TaxID=1410327 RepID=UPI000644BDF8|nr:hypothetical protein SAMD00019534_068290 [Acytostelium subglobosum LB1]GAM23654.1 hypothetical protein SAMD00019534_068290 [Acytostelium subglobosum LB1]|eukprot:XP_012753395.1 hypothetical protein SAMD00019534_068290 [Acytostelium subglobosum LB1]
MNENSNSNMININNNNNNNNSNNNSNIFTNSTTSLSSMTMMMMNNDNNNNNNNNNSNSNLKKRKKEGEKDSTIKQQITLPMVHNPFQSSPTLLNTKNDISSFIIFQHQHLQSNGTSHIHNTLLQPQQLHHNTLLSSKQQHEQQHQQQQQQQQNNQSGSESTTTTSYQSNKRHQFQNKEGSVKYQSIQPVEPKEIRYSEQIRLSLKAPEWRTQLMPEFDKPYMRSLLDFLDTEKETGIMLCPPVDNIFNAFNLTDFGDVKVVILGQDPPHGTYQANGLSFSVGPGPITAALTNIFTELQSDLGVCKKVSHGGLEQWARQGVLLLNTCLTVRKGVPESHSNKGWEQFTDVVISTLSRVRTGIIFLLWGKQAQQKASLIDGERHTILTASHPSQFSAAKGFFGCKHFSKSNNILVQSKQIPIDWDLDIINSNNNNNNNSITTATTTSTTLDNHNVQSKNRQHTSTSSSSSATLTN